MRSSPENSGRLSTIRFSACWFDVDTGTWIVLLGRWRLIPPKGGPKQRAKTWRGQSMKMHGFSWFISKVITCSKNVNVRLVSLKKLPPLWPLRSLTSSFTTQTSLSWQGKAIREKNKLSTHTNILKTFNSSSGRMDGLFIATYDRSIQTQAIHFFEQAHTTIVSSPLDIIHQPYFGRNDIHVWTPTAQIASYCLGYYKHSSWVIDIIHVSNDHTPCFDPIPKVLYFKEVSDSWQEFNRFPWGERIINLADIAIEPVLQKEGRLLSSC